MSQASRDAILARIRSATAGSPVPEAAPRSYRRRGELPRDARIELFEQRVGAYRAETRRLASASVGAEIGSLLATRGARLIGVAPGLPQEWLPEGVEVVVDDGLSPQALDRLDGVVTICELAIAETGTIVLAGGPGEGRRALTLVPDLHVCLVGEDQIVELVTEATEQLAELVRRERRPLTLVSGPSATSDIELRRVEGVHGPRALVVLIVSP